MTAPVPRLSPMAGLVNAMRRHWIRLATPHLARLDQQLAEQQTRKDRLKGGTS